INRVTIVPPGRPLGVTYQRPEADRYRCSEASLPARITGLLGRRTAEEIIIAAKTTGAQNDHAHATYLARNIVTRCGTNDKPRRVQLAPPPNPELSGMGGLSNEKPFSEETAKTIDAEILRILNECHDEARRLLTQHRRELDALANA